MPNSSSAFSSSSSATFPSVSALASHPSSSAASPSPPAPSPSPSTSPAPSPSIPWHLPGPSSRYHQREKSRPDYQRFPSTCSLPLLDSPATRARSSLSSSLSSSSAHADNKSPLPRWSSAFSKPTPAAAAMARNAPRTPIRHSALLLQDSPFSDYFTDEAASFDNKSPYSAPSPSAQRLLVRLHTLGAEILRQDPSEHTTTDLSTKLDDLEATLNAPVAQTRQPAHLADSGLFLEDDDDDTSNNDDDDHDGNDISGTPSAHSLEEHHADDTPVFSKRATDKATRTELRNQDHLLKEAQRVLERVEKANRSLRHRYDEVRRLNHSHRDELEEAAQEVLRLKSENESLKADLGFDHSELLFMKLQLKALEVQIDGLPAAELDSDNTKKVLLNDDIDRWRADWDDVDARLRSRRQVHRVMSTTPTKFAAAREEGRPKTEEQGLWRLDMCKKSHGRVQSITIKRFDTQDRTADDDGEQTLVDEDFSVSRKPSYSEQATQTDGMRPHETAGEEGEEAGCADEAMPDLSSSAEKAQYCEQATQTETTIVELEGEESAELGTEFLGALHSSARNTECCEQATQTDEPSTIETHVGHGAEPVRELLKDSSIQTEEPSYCEIATQTEVAVPNEDDGSHEAEASAKLTPSQPSSAADKICCCERSTQTDNPITYEDATSSIDDEEEYKGESEAESEEADTAPKRTAWQELCDSLSAFAGMDKD